MPEVTKSKVVKPGDWRTLESGWNATFSCRFKAPAGAQIKIRYGSGWWFGWDSQKQTLDGTTFKILNVTKASVAYARVQIKVQHDFEVTYTYIAPGP